MLFKVQSTAPWWRRRPRRRDQRAARRRFKAKRRRGIPSGTWLGVTYGTWRRVLDDAKYPDIAQEIGLLAAAGRGQSAPRPQNRDHGVDLRGSGDGWSPNGKWIAFHSHREQSDDVWLRPAAAGGTAHAHLVSRPRRRSRLAALVARRSGFCSTARAARRSDRSFVIGIDQDTGNVTRSRARCPWRLRSRDQPRGMAARQRPRGRLAKDGPDGTSILTVPRDGGDPNIVHRLASEHDVPGLAVSPDGRAVAFMAPAADGFFQVFRLPMTGGTPVAADDRSVEQDAACLVARRPSDRVHGVELRIASSGDVNDRRVRAWLRPEREPAAAPDQASDCSRSSSIRIRPTRKEAVFWRLGARRRRADALTLAANSPKARITSIDRVGSIASNDARKLVGDGREP